MPGTHRPFSPLHTWQDKITDTTSVWNLGISMCFEKHTVNVCIHTCANMIRRSKGMLPFVPFGPFHKIAFNFCDITMRPWPFHGAAGVGRRRLRGRSSATTAVAADAKDRNSKNRRRRRRLFKTFVVQDVITDAVLSPGQQLIIDSAPSNRSKKNLNRHRDIVD